MALNLLGGGEQLYGLELVRLSGGALKAGTVYVTLERLQAKGLIESELERKPRDMPGRARRLYRVTDAGLSALDLLAQLDHLLASPA
ncbi:MAG: helix-turn-helix transcriptional regulator [Myxococcota bacterium]